MKQDRFTGRGLTGNEIVVGPADNLHEAIRDAGDTPIRLREGIYRGGFKLQNRTRLLACPGEKPVLMGAEPVTPDKWSKNGEAYFLAWDIPFYQHPSKQVGQGEAGIQHRNAMQPHMVVVDGQPLQTVYRSEDLMPGTMYLEGTSDKPKGFWVRFMDDRPPEEFDVLVARYQQILSADSEDASEVELEGLTLRFAANTAYMGLLSFPEKAENWKLTDIDAQWGNTEGIHVRGTGHKLSRLVISNNGQNGLSTRDMNHCELVDIEVAFNNWKGFDPKWDAGNKLRNSSHNILKKIKATGNPIWWDIHNQANWMEDFEIVNSICWGLMVEYHSGNNSFVNGVVRGTRRYGGDETTGCGLRIQSTIKGCEFSNVRLIENEGGAVYYKKKEMRHGEANYSGSNIFDNLEYDGRWVIEGDPGMMADRYKNMKEPAWEVRHR